MVFLLLLKKIVFFKNVILAKKMVKSWLENKYLAYNMLLY